MPDTLGWPLWFVIANFVFMAAAMIGTLFCWWHGAVLLYRWRQTKRGVPYRMTWLDQAVIQSYTFGSPILGLMAARSGESQNVIWNFLAGGLLGVGIFFIIFFPVLGFMAWRRRGRAVSRC